ncbi:hypothetical protein QR680_010525 [Steinernema hermaphroditum]|uniref:Uncharacterized protein n=1 Tax=Steinernema hermaphroditum TaxID=289476 RepID=A0AA39IS01_9BILA|nr:hypothetical protein QR680_010525 [Steinernema hermaphroditum]
MNHLFSYFYATYIGPSAIPDEPISCDLQGQSADDLSQRARHGPTFSINDWNLYDRTGKGPRTNNSVEAWHGVLNRYAAGTPRMIDLLEIIHHEESHCRQAYREYFLNPSKGLKQRHQRHNYSRQLLTDMSPIILICLLTT